MTSALNSACRELLAEAVDRYPDQSPELQVLLGSLDEPLNVAIAGKLKAGKSTLLNALVGEELAPTDAGECTKIVTWYREGNRRRVELRPIDGTPVEAVFTRDHGAIEVDLGDFTSSDLDRIDVEWPSSALRTMSLIDTPGIASLTEGVSARTEAFLTPGDDTPTAADAVVYLMRHLHTTDLDFLEAFHDDRMASATPVNAVALIARADEIGVGRIDSLDSARRIAARYAQEPKLRALVHTVMPVAALIGQAGTTLTEIEYGALSAFAALDEDALASTLLSVDRFRDGRDPPSVSGAERRHLLERLGMFGIRLSIDLIGRGAAPTATALAAHLVDRSGLTELRTLLDELFSARRDVLKARSALLALESIATQLAAAGDTWLAGEVERLMASAHEFVELQMLNAIRAGSIAAPDGEIEDMERLLGSTGSDPARRMGLGADAGASEIRRAAQAELQRWQRRAENPLNTQDMTSVARVLMRTCEAILVAAG